MPPWLWTVLRQSSIYCIVLCRLGARSGTRPCPVQRTVPCRSSECRGFGGCDRLHCRKTSECEGREKLLQTAIFSERRQELRVPPMPSFPPAPSKTLSTPAVIERQWVRVRGEGERGSEAEEKTFRLFPVFVTTPPGKQLEKMAMPSHRRWMTFVPVVNTTTTTRVVQNVQVVFIDFTNPAFGRQSALPNLELQVI